MLPTLWFRNTWSLGRTRRSRSCSRSPAESAAGLRPRTHDLGDRYLYCEGDAALLFTENETNNERLFGTAKRQSVRQGRVSTTTSSTGKQDAVNPERRAPRRPRITRSRSAPGEAATIRLRLQRCRAASNRRSVRGL